MVGAAGLVGVLRAVEGWLGARPLGSGQWALGHWGTGPVESDEFSRHEKTWRQPGNDAARRLGVQQCPPQRHGGWFDGETQEVFARPKSSRLGRVGKGEEAEASTGVLGLVSCLVVMKN